MGFFTKKYDMPKGRPDGWTTKDVKHYLKHKKLDDFKEAFASTDGKALLSLDFAELAAMVGNANPDDLVNSVSDLRTTLGLPKLKRPSSAEAEAPAEASTEQVESGMSRLIVSDRVTADSLPEPSPTGSSVVVPGAMGSVSQSGRAYTYAEVLVAHVLQPAEVEAVSQYLAQTGRIGHGLVEALPNAPAIGTLFGACYQLHVVSQQAVINRDNCTKLGSLGQDILRTVDSSSKRQMEVPAALLESLTKYMEQALQLVQPYSKQGWLLHMTCNESMKVQFDSLHNAVVGALKAESMDTLPTGKALMPGDYRDVTKAVRRVVRQLGSGSVTQGINTLKTCDALNDGVRDVANTLGVQPEALVDELEAVPDTHLDMETYYSSFVRSENSDQTAAYCQIFAWYDKDESGAIEMEEFTPVLGDLGLLDGKKPQEADAFIAANFKIADKSGAGSLGFEDFCNFYDTLTTSKARAQLRTRFGLQVEEDLRTIFVAFSSFGSPNEVHDMDNAHFSKLTKDCHLLNQNLISGVADIIFTQVKSKGARRINFEQFLTAISLCAEKRGDSFEELIRLVLAAGGPTAHGTKPNNVRLHDDKSTYTGVYAKGGPKTVEASKDLSAMLDRSDTDARGVRKTPPTKVHPSKAALPTGMDSSRKLPVGPSPSKGTPTTPARKRTSSTGGGANSLWEAFAAFASFGTSAAQAAGPKAMDMDSSKFAKLCRECGLLDKTFDKARADLVFAKTKPQGHTKITYVDFQKALQLIAEEKKAPLEQVHQAILQSDGPLYTPSRA